MTFKELIQNVTNFGYQFTSCEIPLVDEQFVEIQNIEFTLKEDSDGSYLIQMTIK